MIAITMQYKMIFLNWLKSGTPNTIKWQKQNKLLDSIIVDRLRHTPNGTYGYSQIISKSFPKK